ncbi:MAG: hypothetical protein AAGA85_11890 [Bacteroidota bacterium]
MKKVLTVLLTLLALSGHTQSFFDTAVSQPWTGQGTLLGSPASFHMKWDRVLQDQFYQLEFKHERSTEEGTITFEAMGFYRLIDEASFEGTWLDSRGVSLPLKGAIGADQLTVYWGTDETERGQTVYTLQADGAMVVEDHVQKEGKTIPFGKAVYR